MRIRALIATLLLFAISGVGSYIYSHRTAEAQQIADLQQEKKQLQNFVDRLTDEKRIAELIVTDQKTVDGVARTTLLFAEYARDGSTLPAKTFTLEGSSAHIDAMVIKFDHGLVAQDDPLRGRSIALFCRVFGDKQSPSDAFRIDAPGQIPDIYRGPGDQPIRAAAFEKDLWQNFWKLADDQAYRTEKGVRVAMGQDVWGPFVPGRVYTITLETDGGLNLTSEPIKGIFREVLRSQPATEPAGHDRADVR